MLAGVELTTVERVREDGSYLFTATNAFDVAEEVILVPCEDESGANDGESTANDGESTANDCESASGNCESAADDHVRSPSRGNAAGGVAAWINRCTHEAQRFDTGRGVPMRDGGIICPKHGSFFDSCSGECDNGEAAGTTLPDVDVAVDDGTVSLVDEDYTFEHEGGIDDGDDAPSSTSHVGF